MGILIVLLFCALRALTAFGLYVLVKVLLPIVVGQLLPRPDVAQSQYKHTVPRAVRLAVSRAGVIDVTRLVRRDIAVDHRVLAGPKKISAGVAVLLGSAYRPARILDNARAFWYRTFGKKPLAGFGAPHLQRIVARRVF